MEAEFQRFFDQHYLGMNIKVFISFAESIEDGRGSAEIRDGLVVCM